METRVRRASLERRLAHVAAALSTLEDAPEAALAGLRDGLSRWPEEEQRLALHWMEVAAAIRSGDDWEALDALSAQPAPGDAEAQGRLKAWLLARGAVSQLTSGAGRASDIAASVDARCREDRLAPLPIFAGILNSVAADAHRCATADPPRAVEIPYKAAFEVWSCHKELAIPWTPEVFEAMAGKAEERGQLCQQWFLKRCAGAVREGAPCIPWPHWRGDPIEGVFELRTQYGQAMSQVERFDVIVSGLRLGLPVDDPHFVKAWSKVPEEVFSELTTPFTWDPAVAICEGLTMVARAGLSDALRRAILDRMEDAVEHPGVHPRVRALGAIALVEEGLAARAPLSELEAALSRCAALPQCYPYYLEELRADLAERRGGQPGVVLEHRLACYELAVASSAELPSIVDGTLRLPLPHPFRLPYIASCESRVIEAAASADAPDAADRIFRSPAAPPQLGIAKRYATQASPRALSQVLPSLETYLKGCAASAQHKESSQERAEEILERARRRAEETR